MDDAVHVEVESVELGHDVRELFLMGVCDTCSSLGMNIKQMNKYSHRQIAYICIHPGISLISRSTLLHIFIFFLI